MPVPVVPALCCRMPVKRSHRSRASSYYTALLPVAQIRRWAYYLPLAQLHLNTSPTAALGGRSPYWARYGVHPNVTAIPPLEPLLQLLNFPRWGRWWGAQGAGWRLTTESGCAWSRQLGACHQLTVLHAFPPGPAPARPPACPAS